MYKIILFCMFMLLFITADSSVVEEWNCEVEQINNYTSTFTCRKDINDASGKILTLYQFTKAEFNDSTEKVRVTYATSYCYDIKPGHTCKRIDDNFETIPTPWGDSKSIWTKWRIDDDIYIKKLTNRICYPNKCTTKCILSNVLW